MNNQELAKEIHKNVGGESNINLLSHCVTRLRFNLFDNSKSNKNIIEKLEGVLGVVESGCQFQVVIGNKVGEVYKEIMGLSNSTEKEKSEEVKAGNSIAHKAVDLISSILAPVFNILASITILKGLLAIFVYLNLISTTSGTYQILHVVEDSALYFMSILMTFTAAKKFGANEIVALILGAILVHPEVINFISKSNGTDFLGSPVDAIEYLYTFIMVIISTGLLSKLEKFLNKVINSNLKLFFMPLVCLIIIVPITFIVIGPMAAMITKTVGYIYKLSPIIIGIIIGAYWKVLVIRGIHLVCYSRFSNAASIRWQRI